MVALGALLPVALLPLPVALGVGYGVARQYRPTLARIQLGLERALDSARAAAPARRTGHSRDDRPGSWAC